MMDKPGVHGDVPFFWTDLGKETVRVTGTYDLTGSTVEIVRGDVNRGDFLAVWQTGGAVTGAFSVGYDRELIDIEQTLREKLEDQ